MSVRFPKRWFRKKKIILASGSPRRKELMDLTGLKYQVISPSVDEKVHPEETPRDHVERLAREKAISVAANNPDDVVIGCDTVVILNGRHILGKPQKKKDAKQMLASLAGREHSLRCHRYLTVPFPSLATGASISETSDRARRLNARESLGFRVTKYGQLTPEFADIRKPCNSLNCIQIAGSSGSADITEFANWDQL